MIPPPLSPRLQRQTPRHLMGPGPSAPGSQTPPTPAAPELDQGWAKLLLHCHIGTSPSLQALPWMLDPGQGQTWHYPSGSARGAERLGIHPGARWLLPRLHKSQRGSSDFMLMSKHVLFFTRSVRVTATAPTVLTYTTGTASTQIKR